MGIEKGDYGFKSLSRQEAWNKRKKDKMKKNFNPDFIETENGLKGIAMRIEEIQKELKEILRLPKTEENKKKLSDKTLEGMQLIELKRRLKKGEIIL